MPVSLLVVLSFAVFFPPRSVGGYFAGIFKGQEIVSVSWILSRISQMGLLLPFLGYERAGFRGGYKY